MKRIALLGSRDISVEILEWIVEQNDCEVVGVVAPPFKGWWDDKLADTSVKLGIDNPSHDQKVSGKDKDGNRRS